MQPLVQISQDIVSNVQLKRLRRVTHGPLSIGLYLHGAMVVPSVIPVAVERPSAAQRDSAEFRAYVDEMWRRLRVFSKRSAAIPADAHGSFEWLSAAGSFWWEARERAGLSREQVATRLGITASDVRFVEFGLVTPRDLSEKRLRAYAQALDDPELYEHYRRRFEF